MAFVVKNTMDFRVLDLVCPHSCRGCGRLGGLLCGRCKKHIKKELSVVKKTDFEDLDMYLSPREGILFEMVKEYKYSSVRDMGGVLAELLAEEVAGVLNGGGLGAKEEGVDMPRKEEEVCGAKGLVVVPLPTISRHIRERGFDHTWRLAKEVAKRLSGARAAQLLIREGSSVQVGKEAEEREKQASEAYRADFGAISRYVLRDSEQPTVVLIDDVWTTGASMRAGAKALREAGVKKIVTAVICAGE